MGSTPAPIPESCSQSFTEGLLRHRIKTLEKKVATLKNELNEANSKLKTAVEDVYTSIEGIRRHRSFMVRNN